MKLELTDSITDCIVKMSEGNIGAVSVLSRILKEGGQIDPDAGCGEPLFILLNIDGLDIRGSRIWVLYKYVCGENLNKTIACARACQLGIIGQETLNRAINDYGKDFDVDDVCRKVKEALPNFKLEI